jgi:collagen type I alpha
MKRVNLRGRCESRGEEVDARGGNATGCGGVTGFAGAAGVAGDTGLAGMIVFAGTTGVTGKTGLVGLIFFGRTTGSAGTTAFRGMTILAGTTGSSLSVSVESGVVVATVDSPANVEAGAETVPEGDIVVLVRTGLTGVPITGVELSAEVDPADTIAGGGAVVSVIGG